MALLDAALAFALTLAALATVVTIIMEIGIRFFGLRKRDQFELLKRLYDDHLAQVVGVTTDEIATRREALTKVLKNPFDGTDAKLSDERPSYLRAGLSPTYDEISVEHLLRRLMEVPEIKAAYEGTNYEVKQKLAALAQKYDEYCSAISTLFKRRAQFFSLLVGMVLAVVMNVDGVRLYQSYLDNPEVAAQVIEQLQPKLAEFEKMGTAAQSPPPAEPGVEAKTGDTAAADADAREQFDQAVADLKTALNTIGRLDLPIGRQFYPHCWLLGDKASREDSVDRLCKEDKATVAQSGWLCAHWNDPALLTWLLKVLVTGLLIGLGAPFWYDVAKRLAAVRQAFGGRGSAAQRHRGSDGGEQDEQKSESRSSLIERIAGELSGA